MEPRARKVKRAPSVLLAEFDSARDVLHAAEHVRDEVNSARMTEGARLFLRD